MTIIIFDRDKYFESVRSSLFTGSLSQQQVEGQEAILGEWELPQSERVEMTDTRWLAYMLATTYHETSQTMWPIEEYGKGAGQPYGEIDPETGEAYYGRGDVQLTWKDNYARATKELGLKGDADLVWHPEMALDPQIAADIMFIGMKEGWFRSDDKGPQTLARYFSAVIDDPFEAREIINGDKNKVPSWSNGSQIGSLIAGYHYKFLTALELSAIKPTPTPKPGPMAEPIIVSAKAYGHEVTISIDPEGAEVWIDGEVV